MLEKEEGEEEERERNAECTEEREKRERERANCRLQVSSGHPPFVPTIPSLSYLTTDASCCDRTAQNSTGRRRKRRREGAIDLSECQSYRRPIEKLLIREREEMAGRVVNGQNELDKAPDF